jgi:hypothetical protein
MYQVLRSGCSGDSDANSDSDLCDSGDSSDSGECGDRSNVGDSGSWQWSVVTVVTVTTVWGDQYSLNNVETLKIQY